jgi:hypothetical protein
MLQPLSFLLSPDAALWAAPMPPRKLPWSTIRRLALATEGVEEGTAYGRPAFRYGGKVVACLRPDGEAMMFTVGFEAREHLMKADPRTFFITDHYRNYPSVLARLDRVTASDVKGLLARAFELQDSKRKRPKRAAPTPRP